MQALMCLVDYAQNSHQTNTGTCARMPENIRQSMPFDRDTARPKFSADPNSLAKSLPTCCHHTLAELLALVSKHLLDTQRHFADALLAACVHTICRSHLLPASTWQVCWHVCCCRYTLSRLSGQSCRVFPERLGLFCHVAEAHGSPDLLQTGGPGSIRGVCL